MEKKENLDHTEEVKESEIQEKDNNVSVSENEEKQEAIPSEKLVDNVKDENKKENENEEISENKETQPISDNNKSTEQVEEKKEETVKEIKQESNIVPVKEKKSHKKAIIISCVILAVVIFILLFSTIFALFNNNNTSIINNTYIKGLDVSGLDRDQAVEKLKNEFNGKLSKTITLKHNDYETQITLNQLELSFNFDKAASEAFSRSRSGNIIVDNYNILFSMFVKQNITPEYTYNKDVLASIVKDIESHFDDGLVEPTYYIEENNLIVSSGRDGNVVDVEGLNALIDTIVADLDNANYNSEVPVTFKKASAVDIDKIYKEVYKKPVNATFSKDPYVIYPHTDGVDFAISIDEAKELYKNSSDGVVSIPLKILSPEITINELGNEAFPNELSSYSTSYSTYNYNRSNNIVLAAEKVNGTVVMPGEIFSYNATVGERTSSAGFMTAAVYAGGKVVDGIGGGICQVSSTIYNAALLANLEIVERDNHAFNPGYVPVSRDATVSWGSLDFKFKNTRNYPIKILCDGTEGEVDVVILGLKEENEYDIDVISYVTRWISYDTITEVDPTLAPGETVVVESGSSGCSSVAYRIYYSNGEEISRELLSYDTYSPHNRVIAVGE